MYLGCETNVKLDPFHIPNGIKSLNRSLSTDCFMLSIVVNPLSISWIPSMSVFGYLLISVHNNDVLSCADSLFSIRTRLLLR